ncbi:hypothetical protein L227DRAFT_334793 [Lentinus tigrinus ALCF2SS1-6]|uniref:F-box domain-containing protein n=1 Tax=Lentinus tigrinus ALCF2SS1-6 TaxID=1328759 RepID=A0A5C2RVV3_9APHY|nr:hypothetical protein L227DRAFT_334793 [Lentinus tigrinus ALCF2SS1-6]
MPTDLSKHPISPPILIQELPIEILVDVFALADAIDSWGTLGRAPGRGIAKCMLVCRYWRDVLVETPEFWRRIDTAEPLRIVSMLLERSRGCTIDVRIFYPWIKRYPPLWRETIGLILSHAHRIRSLYVNLHMNDYSGVYQLLETEMPALECLDLVPTHEFRVGRSIDRNYATCSPSRRTHPHIRSLTSQRLYMPAPVDFWRTLRRLKMCDFPRTALRDYSMQDVLAVLRANPALEELVLWWHSGAPKVSPTHLHDLQGASQTSQRQLFALRNLHLFSVHGTVPCVTQLLDHLSLPHDISMSAVSFTTPDFYAFCTPPHSLADPELSSERTAISFESYYWDPLRSPAMRCLIGVLGWVSVRHLSLRGPPSPSEDDSYEQMFDTFPALEELEVDGMRMETRADLFAALSPSPREDGAREVPRCPHLRVLAVHARISGPREAKTLAVAMEACARSRAEAGVRLQKVLLHLWTAGTTWSEPRSEEIDDEEGYLELIEIMRGFVDEAEYECTLGARVCGRCTSAY